MQKVMLYFTTISGMGKALCKGFHEVFVKKHAANRRHLSNVIGYRQNLHQVRRRRPYRRS